jgi:hypothetical protein
MFGFLELDAFAIVTSPREGANMENWVVGWKYVTVTQAWFAHWP